MKNDDLKTQSKRLRSFTQEMQQAFVDWVRKLPFIKSDTPKDPLRKNVGDETADQTSAPTLTDGALAGRPPDDTERRR